MLGFQPGSKEGKGRRQRKIFIHILATATCPSTGLPNAKGKAILSTQWAKYIPHCSAAAPCKAHWAILNDKYFPKVFFFFLHYKDTTLCLHKQAKRAVHSWLGELALSLSDLWARGWKCLGCLVWKEKKKRKKKPAQAQKESKPVCLIKEHHWEPPKAASFPFPAQKGKDDCSSRGFEKGPSLPPREGGGAFQHSTPTIRGRTQAGSWQHPPLRTSSHPSYERSPGTHTPSRKAETAGRG